MSAILSPCAIQKFFDNNGRPLANGLLFTYIAGTSTKVATFVDAAGITQNTNPIVLDARGECNLWLTPGQAYKFVLSPKNDTDPPTKSIWTVDNIVDPFSQAVWDELGLITDSLKIKYAQTLAESAASVTPVNLYVPSHDTCGIVLAIRYDVKADGSTDNATALLNFSKVVKQSGCKGLLPSGQILCSSLSSFPFNSTVGIVIEGISALNGTEIIYTGTGSGDLIDARSSFGFTLREVSLYHNNAGFSGNLINFSHDGSALDSQHGKLDRCAFGSIGSLYTAIAIQLDKATLVTTDGCDFGALLKPVQGQNLSGGSYSVGHRFLNCQFAGNGFYVFYGIGQGWKINGNNFQPNKDGLMEIIATNASTPIDGLEFRGNTCLDASGSSVVLDIFTATGLDISGNVCGCGGSGGIFLRANAQIVGLTMTGGNHISNCNYVITVANAAHSGWNINGNYGSSLATGFIDHPEYVTGINLEGNSPDIRGRWSQKRVAVTYSASMTFDASQGNHFTIIPNNGSAYTINAPLNPIDGQDITVQTFNGNGAPLGAVTWNAIFKMSAWTQPAASNNRSVTFSYNSTLGFWYQISQTGVDVPS